MNVLPASVDLLLAWAQSEAAPSTALAATAEEPKGQTDAPPLTGSPAEADGSGVHADAANPSPAHAATDEAHAKQLQPGSSGAVVVIDISDDEACSEAVASHLAGAGGEGQPVARIKGIGDQASNLAALPLKQPGSPSWRLASTVAPAPSPACPMTPLGPSEHPSIRELGPTVTTLREGVPSHTVPGLQH